MLYPDSECWGYNNTLKKEDSQALTMNGMMISAVMRMINTLTMRGPGQNDRADADLIATAITAIFQ